MKSIAILLVARMLFLVSFAGIGKVMPVTKMDCCKQMAAKKGCHRSPVKDQPEGCEKPGCLMMLSCSICGFIPARPVSLPATLSFSLEKTVSLYRSGDLTAYHKADWKPPKAC